MAIPDDEQQGGAPEWIVTFSDLMSLLLTFFVMLVSMSEIKQEQTMALIQSLRRQFGHSRANLSLVPGRFTPTGAALNRLTSLGRARRMHSMNGGDKVQAPVGDYPRVMAIRPSDESTLGGVIYFEEGRGELTDEHQKTLRQTAAVIRGKPQKIEIWGHTSSRPLRRDSAYQDHWELAYARAVKVMEFLVALGIDPRRIRIGLAAENEPVHEGYDELLRKKNARVEVLMSDRFAEGLRATPKENAGPIRSQRQAQQRSSSL
jgi:chemotaxis protein MotB